MGYMAFFIQIYPKPYSISLSGTRGFRVLRVRHPAKQQPVMSEISGSALTPYLQANGHCLRLKESCQGG